MTVKLSETVPLTVPLAVAGKDGAVTVDSLTVRRPKARHAKQLAALIGADLIKALFASEAGAAADAVDLRRLSAELVPQLFEPARLDAFFALVADLAGISVQEAGEIDPVDFLSLVAAVAGFFPALQSIVSGSSRPT